MGGGIQLLWAVRLLRWVLLMWLLQRRLRVSSPEELHLVIVQPLAGGLCKRLYGGEEGWDGVIALQ